MEDRGSAWTSGERAARLRSPQILCHFVWVRAAMCNWRKTASFLLAAGVLWLGVRQDNEPYPRDTGKKGDFNS